MVSGDDAQIADAREKVAQAMAKQQNIPIDQAPGPCLGDYETQFARQGRPGQAAAAAEAADVAAKSVSRGALLGSLALILGAGRGLVRRQGRHCGPDRDGGVLPHHPRAGASRAK